MKSPHTISVYECLYENENLIEEQLLNISRFSKEGKVLQREQYDAEGNLIKKDNYEYQGDLVVLTSEEDIVEKSVNKTTCDYQEDKIVNQKEYNNEELTIEMVYNYDEDGQLIQNDILNNDGTLSSRHTFEYEGLKTIERYFDEEMKLVRMIETTKDEEGQIVEKKVTEKYEDREEVVSQKIEYKSVDGELTKNYYNNGVETYEVTECFNDQGKIFETIMYDVLKNDESVTTLEYDEKGRVIKEQVELNEEVVSVTNVEFDENGNRVMLVKRGKLADDFHETRTYKFVNEYDEKEESIES